MPQAVGDLADEVVVGIFDVGECQGVSAVGGEVGEMGNSGLLLLMLLRQKNVAE